MQVKDKCKTEPIEHDDFIGRPFTPGAWASTEKNIESISIIRMTCGGGMGGAQWKIYAKRIAYDKFTADPNLRFMEVTTIDDEVLLINTNYIVDVDNTISVHSIDYESENPSYKGLFNMRYYAKDGVKLTYVEDFGRRD